MFDGDVLPDFFYSKGPLSEGGNLINLKNGNFYWMLSLNNGAQFNEFKTNFSGLAPYDDNENDLLDCCDLEDHYEINPTKSGKYITSFYVPSALHSIIIGSRGSKLKELQDKTNTLIKVPKPNEEGVVKITGNSERSVASARTQIALLVLAKRELLSITHFVSIPIYTDNIKTNFLKFKNEILKAPPTRGIDETIFQKVEKLHLTIVTLVLLDDKELNDAKALLSEFQTSLQKIFGGKSPTIIVKGVEIMNDDPSDVNVLYGQVALENSSEMFQLQEAFDKVLENFYRRGLLRKQYDGVKLHVTLMNSLFRKSDGFTQQKSDAKVPKNRLSFDASSILENYNNYFFGKIVLDKIHLSIRFTTGENQYYEPAAIIRI